MVLSDAAQCINEENEVLFSSQLPPEGRASPSVCFFSYKMAKREEEALSYNRDLKGPARV